MPPHAGNGTKVWQWISGILASVIVAYAVGRMGGWFTWGKAAQAAANLPDRIEVQAMVDRGDATVQELLTAQLTAIDKKLDELIAGQGGG